MSPEGLEGVLVDRPLLGEEPKEVRVHQEVERTQRRRHLREEAV